MTTEIASSLDGIPVRRENRDAVQCGAGEEADEMESRCDELAARLKEQGN